MHRVHVNYFVHGAGQNYVGFLFPVFQVFLRATCSAGLPQSEEQPREEQRCPAGSDRPMGTHEHGCNPKSTLNQMLPPEASDNKLQTLSNAFKFCSEPPFHNFPTDYQCLFHSAAQFPASAARVKNPSLPPPAGRPRGKRVEGGGRRRKGQGALSPGMQLHFYLPLSFPLSHTHIHGDAPGFACNLNC